jgi:hypothetical protein
LFQGGPEHNSQIAQVHQERTQTDFQAASAIRDIGSGEQLRLPPVAHPCYQQTIMPIYQCRSEWVDPQLSSQGRFYSNAMSYCSVRETAERVVSISDERIVAKDSKDVN